MQTIYLNDGVSAIMKFCSDNRIAETVASYTHACSTLSKLYKERGLETFDYVLNNELKKNIKAKIERFSLNGFSEERYLFRTLCMLEDYFSGNPFKDKYPLVSRYKLSLEPFYEEWAESFRGSLNTGILTVPVIYSIARDFFYYLQKKEIVDFSIIRQDIIYDFLQVEYLDHKGCMGNVMYVARLLCKFLYSKGFRNVPTELLPFALPPSRKKVLPSFERSDMKSILEEPDTVTPIGKRDYAILMLASVTGIRAIDIANLKLTDINWIELSMHIIQHKTGFGLSLPLDKEAASAVADYILHGRPDTELPYIFLTEVKPYRKLSDKSSVANVLNKYAKLSGIEKAARDGKSFHAFRRSLGTWLLDSGSVPETISQILGHHSKDVLQRYLPLSTDKLTICALGLDDISIKSEVYR